ncbi:MAG: hypothetical protein EBX52_14640, partial [Proteobacteria bacterium]|nr:hypothetical protein [Pseudomonadota bacterium]
MREILSLIQKFKTDFNDAEGSDATLQPNFAADRAMIATFQTNLISALRDSKFKLEYLNPAETRAPQGITGNVSSQVLNGSAPASFTKYFEVNVARFQVQWVLFEFTEDKGCTATLKSTVDSRPFFIGIGRSRNGVNPGAAVKFPFGVALRATVEAPKLLFWPQSLTPTISAVAAARPFGSRIGPSRPQTNIEALGNAAGMGTPAVANMSFYPGDIDDGSNNLPGMGHKFILNALVNRLRPLGAFPPGIGAGQNTRRPGAPSGDCSAANEFTCLALAPTLYEGIFWNAFAFPPSNFETNALRSAFPGEILIQPTDFNAYSLPDRGAPGSNNWHNTRPIAGGSTKPVFFADKQSFL